MFWAAHEGLYEAIIAPLATGAYFSMKKSGEKNVIWGKIAVAFGGVEPCAKLGEHRCRGGRFVVA